VQEFNKYIDQTLLRPDANDQEIMQFAEEVKRFKFYAAVVNPCWVEYVRQNLPDEIKVCSVVGFPLGTVNSTVKIYAAGNLVKIGCDEIDMVMNIGKFKSRDYEYVSKEIKMVVDAAKGRVVKVIIETCLLTSEEKKKAACLVKESGAHFVKTSTGFSKAGAQLDDVRMLRRIVGQGFGVKASGGIRDYLSALEFIKAGANRIGTSSGKAIMEGITR